VLGAFTLVNIFTLVGRPSIANIRTVDIMHLMGTGTCLGGALVALVFFFVFRYRRPDRS
jgi:hypothetical protein